MSFYPFRRTGKKLKELTFWEAFWTARGVLLVILLVFVLAVWIYPMFKL